MQSHLIFKGPITVLRLFIEQKFIDSFIMFKIGFVVCLAFFFGGLVISCTDWAAQYDDISTFVSSPSDQFFLTPSGLAKVSRAFPYKGTSSGCAHSGAHVNFTNTGAPYTVDIIAPAAGKIGRVDKCKYIGSTDRYGVTLNFASSNGEIIAFDFSIEPHDGYLCSGGNDGSDNGFYHSYIFVDEGDKVSKGDVIARMYKSNSGDDGAHVHFNLTYGDSTACPNIFSSAVTTTFSSLFGTENCNGSSYPATFCYLPGSGEDLTGL